MAELRTPELLYSESLDKFNENSESRGFPEKFKICPRSPRRRELFSPRNSCLCFIHYTLKQDVLRFQEHSTNIYLPSSIFDPLNPWWNEHRALESLEQVLRVSENVLCMVFRRDLEFHIAVMYDVIAEEILGVVWLPDIKLSQRSRLGLQQLIISSDGTFVIVLQRSNVFSDKPTEYLVYLLGLDSCKCQTGQKDPSASQIFGKIRVYSALHYILENLSGIENKPIRIDFIPAHHSYQYLISCVKNFPDRNGNREDAYLAKMDIRSKDQTAVVKLSGTQMNGIDRNTSLKNIVFARDGHLIITCFENLDQIGQRLSSRHAIISSATLDILARLEHDLVMNIWEPHSLCYINATPLISKDESCIAIASSLAIFPTRPDCSGNIFWDHMSEEPEGLMNVYRLPAVPQSLESLAKLCVKRCTRNNPNKIKKLDLPPSLRRYVYDY